jgi:uncharacterized protein YjbI with pentapeptide repeats
MPLNFSGKNLRGCSFRGQNLTGADFSHADIRGVDFSNAILLNANFSHAQAGVKFSSQIALLTISFLISVLLGFTGWLVGMRRLPTMVVCAIVGGFLIYIGWQALVRNNSLFARMKNIAVAFFSIKGTSFRCADLTDADFTFANLKYTDFRNANIIRTNFHKSKDLDFSRVSGTILSDGKVRNLLVSKRGTRKDFFGCNLQGANLAAADLSYANLAAANICDASFAGAWLEGCNFTQTQALNTNFQQAKLTGACLEAWNIDSTTNLDGVICDYVYLLNNQRERRPSSGKFALGDFTKIFQPVLHTVDLIFRNGINLEALTSSFQQLEVENLARGLAIRSIENIGDGVVLVRVLVPLDANKEELHTAVLKNYQLALKLLEEKYQEELRNQVKQVEDWKSFAHNLDKQTVNNANPGKLVVLKLGTGDFQTGFPVTLQMGEEGSLPSVEYAGKLPPYEQIYQFYEQWKSSYRKSLIAAVRLTIPETEITHVNRSEFFEECISAAETLKVYLYNWLNCATFRLLKERIGEKLNPDEAMRVILQTENSMVQQLPWHVWDLFELYSQAEMALSNTSHEKIEQLILAKNQIKILAIIGNSRGIDVQKNQVLLEEIPDAQVTFLVEPQLQHLNANLWSQNWDIIFFSGHNCSYEDAAGKIYINQRESLTIPQLKHGLRDAIAHGLSLAIFNCDDGLKLADSLAELHLPQMIVMREPVPDIVAQEFFQNFLTAFASGKPLYQSVRQAREKLQGLEDIYPCVTWLPVICQNSAEIPLNWEQMKSS